MPPKVSVITESEICVENLDYEESIYTLPLNVLQLICQILIDSRSFDDCVDFRDSLYDVMNLRATCVLFSQLLNEMLLYLDSHIHWWPKCDRENGTLFGYFDVINRRTSWRFRVLRFSVRPDELDYLTLEMLQRNQKLFFRSVTYVYIDVLKSYSDFVNELLLWLKSIALKKNAQIMLRFNDPTAVISNPDLISRITFSGWSDPFVQGHVMHKSSCFSNLLKLDIGCVGLHQAVLLEALPKLKSLRVGHLGVEFYEKDKNMPTFSNIKILGLRTMLEENCEIIPSVISHWFPCLESFEFHETRNVKIDFSWLPETCKIMRTEFHLLECFVNCKFIKFLSLNCAISPFLDLDFVKLISDAGNLKILVVNVSVTTSLFPLTDALQLITDIITNCCYLEVLCIHVRSWTGHHNFINNLEEYVIKVLYGDKNFESSEFPLKLDRLEEIRGFGKIQMMIIGRTILMKKSANSALFRELDTLENDFDCGIWPRNATVLTLDY